MSQSRPYTRMPIVTPLNVNGLCPLCERPFGHAVLRADLPFDICVPCGITVARTPSSARPKFEFTRTPFLKAAREFMADASIPTEDRRDEITATIEALRQMAALLTD